MLKKFYHVNIEEEIEENYIFESKREIELKNLGKHNLSTHGERYLTGGNANSFYELMYEIVRKNYYPHRISRLESLFAFETLEEAIKFAREYRENYKCNILEVTSKEYEIFDMNYLDGGSGEDIYNKCLKYWEGELTPNPTKECLLKLPVKVNKIYRLKI